jgi:hypothetical protein
VTPEVLLLVRAPTPDEGDIDQVTPWPDRSLLTVALMSREFPACTEAEVSEAVTVTAEKVIVAELDLEVSATAVAFTVMVMSLGGGAAGAVYVVETPLVVEVGETLPHCDPEQLTLQVTPRPEVSLVTVAVKEAVPPAGTLGEPAVTATETTGGGPITEAGPLQATIIAVKVKTKAVRSTVAKRFMAPPHGSTLAPAGRLP